jgi:hypothetical protein
LSGGSGGGGGRTDLLVHVFYEYGAAGQVY